MKKVKKANYQVYDRVFIKGVTGQPGQAMIVVGVEAPDERSEKDGGLVRYKLKEQLDPRCKPVKLWSSGVFATLQEVA